MRSIRVALQITVLLPLLLIGADSGTLLSRRPSVVPERLRAPLPARLDPATLTTTEALRSLGFNRLPSFRHVRQRLCRGDAAERVRFHDGVVRAAAEPGMPLRQAYWELAVGCEDSRDHCEWLAAETDRTTGEAADFAWSALAFCWPLDEPARFEGNGVPDDAVVGFHAKRKRADRVHSARLAIVVDRRIAAGDAAAAREALDAYSHMDHPATAQHLLRLHAAATDVELQVALAAAMRNQSDPEASKLSSDTCVGMATDQIDARPRSGGETRVPREPWGYPCAQAKAPTRDPFPTEDQREDPLAAIPETLGRLTWLDSEAGFQFDDHTGLLRDLADLLRPELDDAFFDDVSPALNAVSLRRGPHPILTFINGDGITVGVPERDSAPDVAVADAIAGELTAALSAPRVFEVWWRGEQFRFAHHGVGDDYDVNAALAIANFLLAEADATRRVARLANERGLAVLVAEPAGMAEARARGLLAESPDSSDARARATTAQP